VGHILVQSNDKIVIRIGQNIPCLYCKNETEKSLYSHSLNKFEDGGGFTGGAVPKLKQGKFTF
jgi:hypothetical protein